MMKNEMSAAEALSSASSLWSAHSSNANWTVFWDRPVRVALGRIRPVCGNRILVLGCGDGPVSAHLAREGAHVVGLDLSFPALAAAGRHGPGPVYLQADASRMPVADATFDVTLSVSSLQYMPIAEVVENCRRALRPGGVSVFIENLAGNPAAKVDRLRRRVLRTPEPPTMRIRRHIELADLAIFRRMFTRVTAEVWYDWSTVLLPLLTAPLMVRHLVTAIVLRTGRAIPPSAWRSRFGWIVSIEARV